jgi:alpha-N-acetylglucosamine transferase
MVAVGMNDPETKVNPTRPTMTINLADYVDKFVTITTRYGDTEVGTVKYNESKEFPYQINDQEYTQAGKWISTKDYPTDIVKIEEYIPPSERYCESCQYWENGYCDFPNTTLSEKRNAGDAFVEIVATADDDQGLFASLKTGPKFGCIHHKGVWE